MKNPFIIDILSTKFKLHQSNRLMIFRLARRLDDVIKIKVNYSSLKYD